jgi:gas vesicle protein
MISREVFMRIGAFITGVLMGGFAGAALGILTAPKSGSDLREDLVDVSENLYRKAAYELEELAEKVEELKLRIEMQDFSPKLEKAQEALKDTRATTAESQEVLQRQQPTQSQGIG